MQCQIDPKNDLSEGKVQTLFMHINSSVNIISHARNCIFVGFGHLRLEIGFPPGCTDGFGANTSFDRGLEIPQVTGRRAWGQTKCG